MKLKAQDLQTIVNATLEHYNRRAEGFWAGTRDHDVIEKAVTPFLWRFSRALPMPIHGKQPRSLTVILRSLVW